MNQDDQIHNLTQLRKIIPPYPKMMDKRIKDSLDSYSREFLLAAKLAIFSCSALKYIEIIALNVVEFSQMGETRLHLKLTPSDQLNFPEHSTQHACTLYFLVAGIGHGLRINGTVNILNQKQHETIELEIHIEKLYFHCSRAIVRANFWDSQQTLFKDQAGHVNSRHDHLNTANQDFITHSPLAFICSQNALGNLEISPRGDAPGFIKVLPGNILLIPERPGNKVAITLRNILEQPTIKLLMLIPKSNRVLQLSGQATLTNRPDYLQDLTFKNKAPKLAILLKIQFSHLCNSSGLAKSDIWNSENHHPEAKLSSFPKIMNTHLHGESLAAKTLQPVVGAIIKHDLKHLY